MEWRQVATIEDRPFGMWTRAELDEIVKAENAADTSVRRSIAAQNRPKVDRPLRTGEHPCPDCPAMLSTPSAVGSHRWWKHGYHSPRRRSLPAA